MREIKFRAWDKKESVMRQVRGINWTSGIVDFEQKFAGRFSYADYQLLDDVHLMQYTGLKDKNGVEIYEGDIVKVPDDWDGFGWWAGHVGSVVYEDGYFGLSNPNMKHPGYLHEVVSEIEVIGNIYENPELLEAGL